MIFCFCSSVNFNSAATSERITHSRPAVSDPGTDHSRILVNACEGLPAGLYHYDAPHHRLGRLCGRTGEVEHLLADDAASADIAVERVQVVILLSARFQRLAWKYASIAYALILKHVGVVYQTMYLTARAMDLAPCALDGDDAEVFAHAADTDYYAETSVGEFLLGRSSGVERHE